MKTVTERPADARAAGADANGGTPVATEAAGPRQSGPRRPAEWLTRVAPRWLSVFRADVRN